MVIERFKPENSPKDKDKSNQDSEFTHPHDAVWENMSWDHQDDTYLGFVDDGESASEVERYESLSKRPSGVDYAIKNGITLVPQQEIPVSAEGVSVPRDEHDRNTLGMLALIGETRKSNGYASLAETTAGFDMLLSRKGETVSGVLSKATGSTVKASQHEEKFYQRFHGDELVAAGFEEEDVKNQSRAMSREMEDTFFGTKEKYKENRKQTKRIEKRLS